MNYIKRLEQDNSEMRQQLRNIRDMWIDLQKYLQSPKFYAPDHYVNPDDVLMRLNSIGFETLPPNGK